MVHRGDMIMVLRPSSSVRLSVIDVFDIDENRAIQNWEATNLKQELCGFSEVAMQKRFTAAFLR